MRFYFILLKTTSTSSIDVYMIQQYLHFHVALINKTMSTACIFFPSLFARMDGISAEHTAAILFLPEESETRRE
jgi:hypothetical protein